MNILIKKNKSLIGKVSDALAKFYGSRTLGSLGQFVKQLAPVASTW